MFNTLPKFTNYPIRKLAAVHFNGYATARSMVYELVDLSNELKKRGNSYYSQLESFLDKEAIPYVTKYYDDPRICDYNVHEKMLAKVNRRIKTAERYLG